jgi:phosphoesterase RecJ-like protein
MPSPVLATLLDAERVVITTHLRPDGDALGSQIGLGLFLRKLGKHVTLLNADAPPRNLEWMLELSDVTTFTGALKQLKRLNEADVLVVVDTGVGHRIGDLEASFRDSPATKLLIDHHPDPEHWFDHSLLRTDAAATGELVYDLIAEHDADLIDAHVATALYAAIMTDTGSFRYGSTTARVHQITADLLERGDIAPEPIHVAIFDTRLPSSLRLLSRALDTITTVYDGQLAYVVVSLDAMNGVGARSDEAEGVVSYPLSLEGVRAVVMFLETPSGIKCSFRSKGALAINGWARQFGGGGHRNAAGAYLRGVPLRDAVDRVIAAAPKHLDLGDEYELSDEISDDDIALLASFQGKL